MPYFKQWFPGMIGVLALLGGLPAGRALGQTYVPGVSYYGRSNYVQYIAGDLPFVLSAPHGGTLTPAEIPDRTNCPACSGWDFSTVTDTATDDVAAKVKTELGNLTGHFPHIIICHLARVKVDCNRPMDEGTEEVPAAIIAWNEFQSFINSASNSVIGTFGRGFYIDQHGQGHPEQRLELGYLLDKYDLTNTDARLDAVSSFKNGSSIRTLANAVAGSTSFSQLLRGLNSFGEFMVREGYPATPSYTTPAPFSLPSSSTAFFNGGYNTDAHGAVKGGPLSALQIEANYTGVRDSSANRTAYAKALARTLETYFALYYGLNLRTSGPSTYIAGTGNWSSAGNWALGIVPVSTNYLVFAGPGGTATHNVAALATGAGVLSSVSFGSATGAYTLGGNALSLLGGLTNSNPFTNIINNDLTLLGNGPFAVKSGALTLNGVLSGEGGFTKTGPGTLALTAVNTQSGPVTNLDGTISLNATATLGDGTGWLVLAGGDLLALNTRSTAPLANPVLLTGDSTIWGNGLLTNSNRILPFSGSVATLGGTLTLRNMGNNPYASNNTFRVRFTGGSFAFTQPVVLGLSADLPGSISQLESYNDAAAGDQTFSGPISGPGQFRRDAASAASAGRTILSGSNTYAGGTFVLTGTLLVHNAVGSGTGSGVVSVSSSGILGGTGTVAGPVVCSGVLTSGPGSVLSVGGGLDLSAGGTNAWELDALSESGPGTAFGQVVLGGGMLVLGGSSCVSISFGSPSLAPTNANPFWLVSHSWKVIALSGSASNSGGTRFARVNNGSYRAGTFTSSTDAAGNVWLNYLPVPAVRPVLEGLVPDGTGGFDLVCATETNRTYVLQTSTNLLGGGWVALRTNVAPGGTLSFSGLIGGEPRRFYRVVVAP